MGVGSVFGDEIDLGALRVARPYGGGYVEVEAIRNAELRGCNHEVLTVSREAPRQRGAFHELVRGSSVPLEESEAAVRSAVVLKEVIGAGPRWITGRRILICVDVDVVVVFAPVAQSLARS